MAYEELKIRTETGRCLLCHDAPCTQACPFGLETAGIMRSLRFENETGAARKAGNRDSCAFCAKPCMEECTRGKIDRPVDIPFVLSNIRQEVLLSEDPDLTTQICGVRCENPFFLSSSVVGSNYEMVAKAFDMGWAGVAFKTIGTFVPAEASPRFGALEKENNPFIGFKNIEQISDHTLEENIRFISDLKRDYPSKVIIASIMGQNEEEWTMLASLMEEAGADIIECNFSCPQMVGEGLGSDVGTNPELVARYTRAAKKKTSLPVLAKMTPNITDMTVPARAAAAAGADGIAAINTIKSIMNISPATYASAPDVCGYSAVGGYSGKAVKPIALRFIYDMKSDPLLADLPVSGMGGIETWKDAFEFMAMGCSTVQITTAVMQYGYRIIDDLVEGLKDYLRQIDAKSVSSIIGCALDRIVCTDDVDRSSVEFPGFDRKSCTGCGRCFISCFDGGHQAITLNKERKPVMNPEKCVGCQLCVLVCPTHSIRAGKRVAKAKPDFAHQG